MTEGGSAVLYAAARWLDYLAAFLFIGGVAFRVVVWPRALAAGREGRGSEPPIGPLLLGAAVVLVAALGARLYLQARSLADPEEPITRDFLGLVLGTAWGRGWWSQLAAAASGLVGAGLALVPRTRSAGRALTGLAAIGLAVTAPWTGHAVAIPEAGRYGWLLDAAHFGGGATWLGTLVVLVLVALHPRRRGPPSAAALVAAFSPLALAAGLLTMGAGLVMGYRYLGGLAPLLEPGYGRALLVKLSVLAVVAGLGAYHWRVGLPRLRAAGDAGPLRKSAMLEALAAALLLAATAVLVALPLPGEH